MAVRFGAVALEVSSIVIVVGGAINRFRLGTVVGRRTRTIAIGCSMHHIASFTVHIAIVASTRGFAAGSHVAAVSLCSKCNQPPAPLPASPYFTHIRMDVHPCFQHSITAKWAVAAKNNNLGDLGLTVSNTKVENERRIVDDFITRLDIIDIDGDGWVWNKKILNENNYNEKDD